ncbi:MAG: LysM peptidoglycan-binding domain-containing protein [Anaerolineales bacterium]
MKYLNLFPQIYRKFNPRRVVVLILLIQIILLNAGSNEFIFNAFAQSPCGDTYIVLPGDTIEGIADLCGTTVDAILKINPEIADPDNLYPGQIIRIPEAESVVDTIIAIAPACGIPGTSLLVVGSGFPINTNVQLSIWQKGFDPVEIGETTSDEFGRIDTSAMLPSSAQPGTIWVVTGETQISSAKFIGVSNEFSVIPLAPNPNAGTTYIAQEGDTLIKIAVKFNRDLESLLVANPQITGTNQLNSGQLLNIPPQEPGTPLTTVNPICGPVETDILVNGTGFPPVTTINLRMGQYLVSYEQVGTTSSNPSRTFQTQLTIPSTAQIGEYWVVIAGTSSFPNVRSTSNIFIITQPKDPKEPSLYIVKPGDTLNAIAAEYTQTVASLLAVNTQISNPNQLDIGEKIIIPGHRETILITPISGPQLTIIQVGGLGFPPFSAVTLGLSRDTVIYSIEGAVTTDVNGFFRTDYIIPFSAQPGEIWTVVAIESDATGGEIIARSNEFTVTSQQPLLQPILTIWPPEGPPGTALSVVGSNFPSNHEILYTFGLEEESQLISSTTWTEINGTFAIDLFIPISAEIGEGWVVTAESIDNPQISTISPVFSVVEP